MPEKEEVSQQSLEKLQGVKLQRADLYKANLNKALLVVVQ